MISCKVCGCLMRAREPVTVLGKYRSDLMHCSSCGYLCFPEPGWLDEAYSSAIACTDTGIVARNIAVAEQLSVLLFVFFNERGKGLYLDVGGGTGLLVRLMRDFGFDFRWSDKYSSNILSAGFEWEGLGNNGCVAVTAMEALEHVTEPLAFIQDALNKAGSDTIIFSTSVYEGEPPRIAEWSYYSINTGQHVSFFSRKTLMAMAGVMSMHYVGYGDLHVFSRKPALPSEPLFRLVTSRARKAFLPFIRLPSLLVPDHMTMINRLAGQSREEA